MVEFQFDNIWSVPVSELDALPNQQQWSKLQSVG
jgi:hypothetical protein